MSDVDTTGLERIFQESAPLRARIIEAMRRAIERGMLRPGERLVEKNLCQQLGVSRTSLREALRELEATGIVARSTARSLTVVEISRRDAENIYAIRADIEALIAEQFCGRASDADMERFDTVCQNLIETYERGDFLTIIEAKRVLHVHLCNVADNAVALELLLQLTLRTAQLRRGLTRRERQVQSISEIKELRRAVMARDVAAARKAARRHVLNAAATALQQIKD